METIVPAILQIVIHLSINNSNEREREHVQFLSELSKHVI